MAEFQSEDRFKKWLFLYPGRGGYAALEIRYHDLFGGQYAHCANALIEKRTTWPK
jgi:hypothetical protein